MPFCEDELIAGFQAAFHTADVPIIVRSPGRVNIIGEHTDYNDGFVLPAAIDRAAYVAVHKRDDRIVSLYAAAFDEYHEVSLSELVKQEDHWSNYVLGIADQLMKSGIDFSGFTLYLTGDIPIGAGLSSSAAVECATLFALDALFDLGLTRAEMVHLAQRAEHEFAGVKCGVMDMFASLFGKKGHVLNLDCRSLLYDYVPLDLAGYKILLLNTNVRHKLSSSEYNARREQCEQGVTWVREQHPEVRALRDVTLEMLERIVLPKDEIIHRRCTYVVEENKRLTDACRDLKNGDLKALGQKMYQTHEGLRTLYEVSCRELDFLVDHMRQEASVIGARMMGGGFGGCTINLVREHDVQSILPKVEDAYRAATGLELTSYLASIEDGTGLYPATTDTDGITALRQHEIRKTAATSHRQHLHT